MNRLLLIIIMFIGLALRLYFISANSFVIDSDEAIVGLMAKHMLEGADFPVFYYGQDYMGSLEAILTSIVFKFFGQSNLCLKTVPLISSIALIYLAYLLTLKFVNQKFALMAAAFTAVAQNSLLLWSGKTRGGFIELVVIGSVCFLLTFRVFEGKTKSIIPLTFLLGLGWWTNNQIIFYIIPMALFCAYALIKQGSFLKFIPISILSFAFGSAPFWYANIFNEPKWATFKVLFGGTSDVDVLKNVNGFLLSALPILLGARKFWTEVDFFPGASILAYILFLSALFFFYKNQIKHNLVIAFIATAGFVFCFSKFGWLSLAPRYLLPLYSVIPVIYAVAASEIFNRYGKNLTSFFCIAILGLQIYPVFTTSGMIEGMPIVYLGQRVQREHKELYDWLEKENYSFIDTNYWIGYRIAFETHEKVKFSVFGEPETIRIKSYEEESTKHPLVYVLVPLEANQVKNTLNHFGFAYRENKIGEYVVIDKISATWKLGQEIKLQKEQIKSEIKPENLGLIIDGDITTRWGSAKHQTPGMIIDLELSKEGQDINAIEIDYGNFAHDAPRRLVIYGEKLDGQWDLLSDMGNLGTIFSYFPDDHGRPSKKWIIRFSDRKLKTIRLVQQGSHPVFDWSIAELKLYSKN